MTSLSDEACAHYIILMEDRGYLVTSSILGRIAINHMHLPIHLKGRTTKVIGHKALSIMACIHIR
jgi:hypothetical protein